MFLNTYTIDNTSISGWVYAFTSQYKRPKAQDSWTTNFSMFSSKRDSRVRGRMLRTVSKISLLGKAGSG
jgi:hypothetical protein